MCSILPPAAHAAAAAASSVPLVLIGDGGHASVVRDVARLRGYHVCAVLDDDSPAGASAQTSAIAGAQCARGPVDPQAREILERARLDSTTGAAAPLWFCAVGDNRSRFALVHRVEAIAREIGTRIVWALLVHPAAVCAASAVLAPGTLVCAGAVLQPHVRVQEHCIINTGASADHHCTLAPFVHLAPGARLCGRVSVEQQTLVGCGACVLPHVCIGAQSVIGAGATVLADVPSGVTRVGVVKRAV